MPCCNDDFRSALLADSSSGHPIDDAKTWLPFPKNEIPPGGWDLTNIRANSPEHAADQFAAQLIRTDRFVSMEAVYREVGRAYCSRQGITCRAA